MILLATAVLLAEWFCQPPKGTLSPPPGPHQAGDVWMADLGGKTTMAMVWCPPGKFMMGSPVTEIGRGEDDETLHEVNLVEGFWIGKSEVTQRQWQAIMGNNPSCFPKKKIVCWKIWKWDVPVWKEDIFVNRWELPVEQVMACACADFCQKAGPGFRLPTECEWEYACRAGSAGPHAGTGVLKNMGWFQDNSGERTHPVGRKQPNAWGINDMHGNVWEFCQSSEGWNMQMMRGGFWGGLAVYSRSSSRVSFPSHDSDNSAGFRLLFSSVVFKPSEDGWGSPSPTEVWDPLPPTTDNESWTQGTGIK